jgi:hypothetical protein
MFGFLVEKNLYENFIFFPLSVNHHLINGICAETDFAFWWKIFCAHSILNCSNYNGCGFGFHSTKGLRVSMTTGGDLSKLVNTGQITEIKVLYLFHWILLFWGVLVFLISSSHLFLFLELFSLSFFFYSCK